MQCPKCQRHNQDDSRFCAGCGQELATPPPPPPPLPRPAAPEAARTLTREPAASRWAAGQTLAGKYTILGELGRGGMGEVYLAEDTSLDRKVALKFLPEATYRDPTMRARFVREAKAAAALNHPYICSIHEVGEVEDKLFFAMELRRGEDPARPDPSGSSAAGPGPPGRRRDRRGYSGGPREGSHPPGHQAREHHADARGPRQGDGLRPGQAFRDVRRGHDGGRPAGDGDRGRPDARDAGLHVAGAAARPGRSTRARTSSRSASSSTRCSTGRHPFKKETGMTTASAILGEEPQPIAGVIEGVPEGFSGSSGGCWPRSPAERYASMAEVLRRPEADRRRGDRGEGQARSSPCGWRRPPWSWPGRSSARPGWPRPSSSRRRPRRWPSRRATGCWSRTSRTSRERRCSTPASRPR